MNFSTTNADFKTLKNGVDERIAFIQHIETGYYNITKARNIVHTIKSAENEEDIIVSSSLKPAKYWFESIDFDGLDDFSEEDNQLTLMVSMISVKKISFNKLLLINNLMKIQKVLIAKTCRSHSLILFF